MIDKLIDFVFTNIQTNPTSTFLIISLFLNVCLLVHCYKLMKAFNTLQDEQITKLELMEKDYLNLLRKSKDI